VFLIGFMGSGKSTVGRALAARLGRRFVDTDRLIEDREGRSIDRIFEQSGEGYFRGVEHDVLNGLGDADGLVVATGGGLFLGAEQRRWIRRRGIAVWLDVPLEVLRRRLGEGAERPLWNPDDAVGLRALFAKRRATYALADLRIDASVVDVDAVVTTILERVPDLATGGG